MGTDVRGEYRRLTNKLIEKGLTITTMESVTSGQIASLITDTQGASAILKGAFITYSNEAKVMAGVPEKVIEEYNVYSKETALAMAKACKDTYQADIGIGVTGTLANVDPANLESSIPGVVYAGIVIHEEELVLTIQVPLSEDRLASKYFIAGEIVKELLLRVEEENV